MAIFEDGCKPDEKTHKKAHTQLPLELETALCSAVVATCYSKIHVEWKEIAQDAIDNLQLYINELCFLDKSVMDWQTS